MITRFHIENFKSLSDFSLPAAKRPLPRFACLIGLNGSGKSTLLQALDFAGHVIRGGVTDWLKAREWKATDLVTNLGTKRPPLVDFRIEIRMSIGVFDIYSLTRFRNIPGNTFTDR